MKIEMSIKSILQLIIKNIENKNYFNAIELANSIIEQIEKQEKNKEKTSKDD